jgi:hypothetical protein
MNTRQLKIVLLLITIILSTPVKAFCGSNGKNMTKKQRTERSFWTTWKGPALVTGLAVITIVFFKKNNTPSHVSGSRISRDRLKPEDVMFEPSEEAAKAVQKRFSTGYKSIKG